MKTTIKHAILLALACIPAMGFAQNTFILNGKIDGVKPQTKIYLSYGPRVGRQYADSAIVVNGTFQFKGSIGNEPYNAELQIDHKGVGFSKLDWIGDPFDPILTMGRMGIIAPVSDVLNMYVEKGEMNLIAKDSIKNAVFTSAGINMEYAKLKQFIAKPLQEIIAWNREMSAVYGSPKRDTAYLRIMGNRRQRIRHDKEVLQLSFIRKNPDTYLSLLLLAEMETSHMMSLAELAPAYYSLSANLRNTAQGQRIGNEIEKDAGVSIGKVAPDFTQNDAGNHPVKLSQFRGKYVLLDFWASWCVPCRAENPNLVKAYQQYKDKNFTILGVSLDNPDFKAKWLAAVKDDGLSWTQLADMVHKENEVGKRYAVSSIPQNFLIDPDGKIIGKNLRGEELNKKLASLFE